MKRIFLYEPCIASNNIGDQIIVQSLKREMAFLLSKNFCIEFPTHTPISNRYMYFLGKPDLKIICGSNLIVGKINHMLHLRQWMLSPFTSHHINNSIFIGVGAQQYNQRFSLFTRMAYKKFFNKNYIHSVRDSYTKEALNQIGIDNVMNTGCPTMWCLTKEHCNLVPEHKAENVVFTLTDYKQDKSRDELLIETLIKEYKRVYFFPQGFGDYQYFKTLKNNEIVTVINPHLSDYDDLLKSGNIDYVGTRLHGGIRALQLKVRTFIISVDNRAAELHKDFNIPVIDQKKICNLSSYLNSVFKTEIHLPLENIAKFKQQFI